MWVGVLVHANGGGRVGEGVRPHTFFASSWLFPAWGVMGKCRHAAYHRPITLSGPPGAILVFGGVRHGMCIAIRKVRGRAHLEVFKAPCTSRPVIR